MRRRYRQRVIRVHLVGRVAVEVDGAAVSLPPGRATDLLAWLAAHPGLHPRSRVAPVFWPDVPDATARASLRTALWSLRKVLGDGVLTLDRNAVGFAPEAAWVDLRDSVDAVGVVLPGIDAEWADEVRADWQRATAARLSAEAAGDGPGALEAARRLAALDPYSEEHHRLLLRRLVTAGERGAAVREHEAFRRKLWDDLRVRPSPETRDLVAALTSAGGDPVDVGGVVRTAAALPPRLVRAGGQLFVGRDDEHERLWRAWASAVKGLGPVVMLLCGEPGIGKSSLAARFAMDVQAEGGTVLFGEAAEDELLPAEPFLDAIGEHHSLAPGELVDVVRRRIESMASAQGPLLLVLDDFQWADTVSFAVLRRLVRSRAAERLAVLVAYRPDGGARARFGALEGDLDDVVRIELGPLSAAGTGTLLAQLDPALSDQAARIHDDTGGNPLFVHELGRYLLEGRASTVPDTVRNLAVARLKGLSEQGSETVLAAAVLGQRAELWVVRQMVSGRADALGALEEAAAFGLIDEESAGVHVFRHSLVRDALYECLSKSRRAELHRRAADAIALVQGDDGRRLCDIAEHRCAAVPPESPSTAVAAATRAGEWAIDHHAYDRAVVVLTKALPLADDSNRRDVAVRRAVAFQRLSHSLID